MKKRTLLLVGLALLACNDVLAQRYEEASSKSLGRTLPSALPSSPENGTILSEDSRPTSPGAGFLADMAPGSELEIAAPALQITFVEEVRRPVAEGGPELFELRQRTVSLALDADIESIDLPDDGKRVAVLTLTAKRHAGLLANLRDAKTEEDKEAAESALRENYQKHYAIETWWRQQKLKKLEEELAALKAQVQKRVDSEMKYVEAAMTIAQLHVDGVSITPPVPAAPNQSGAQPLLNDDAGYYAQPMAHPPTGRYPTSNSPPPSLPPTTRYFDSSAGLPGLPTPPDPADALPTLGETPSHQPRSNQKQP